MKQICSIKNIIILLLVFSYIILPSALLGNGTNSLSNLKNSLALKSDTNIQLQTMVFVLKSPVLNGIPDYDPGATVSSGLPITYSSSDTSIVSIRNSKIHIKQVGSVTITAIQPGNDTVYFVSIKQTLTIIQKAQSITFILASPVLYGTADYNPGAISTAGLSVSYSSSDTSIVSILNNKIHIKNVGSCIITASQIGNDSVLPATPASQILSINMGSIYALGQTDTVACGKNIGVNSTNVSFLGLAYNETGAGLRSRLTVTTSATGVMGKFPINVTGPSVYGNYYVTYISGNLYVVAKANDLISSICPGDSIVLGDSSLIRANDTITKTYHTSLAGCDSVVTYSVKLITPDSAIYNIKKCAGDSIKIGNNYVKTSGVYKDTIRYSGKCDSLYRTINLTFQNKPKVDGGLDQEICKGDSVNLVATGIGNVTWQGYADTSIWVKPSATTVYMAVAYSCDSFAYNSVIVKVDIKPVTPSVYLNNGELTTDINTNLYSVQWCENRFGVIKSATDWKYLPKISGSYYVIAENGQCYSNPSDAVPFVLSDIAKGFDDLEVHAYPNPVENDLQLSLKSGINKIEVYNTIGKLIISKITNSEQIVRLDASAWKGGIYMVKIWPSNNSLKPIVKAVIKE